MALPVILTRLESEFTTLAGELRGFAKSKSAIGSSSDFSLSEECYLEGALSRVWQAWCAFCRSCVIESCLGTTTGNGIVVTPHALALSDAHVSGAANRARDHLHCWGPTNSILRKEPTWGDVDVLVKILPRLAPGNSPQLLASFSAGSQGAKALQMIRNAAAHDNYQTRAEVMGMRSAFIVFPINHPIQALFWQQPTSGDFLIFHAIDDLRAAAAAAIS
jgi:hypothetical protein